MTTLAVMQPTYLPWLGYFDLMDQVDEFVLLDSVQFSYQSWQHRNRIVGSDGEFHWLTIPVKRKGRSQMRIDEIQLAERPFADDHIARLRQAYDRSPHSAMLSTLYEELARSAASAERLCEVTIPLLRQLATSLGITTPIIRSSDLPVHGARTLLLRSICQDRGATVYLSPPGALQYLQDDQTVFDSCGIEVLIHQYEHPVYPQHRHSEFTPFASVVDVIANLGPDSANTMRRGRGPAQTLAAALERGDHP